MKEVMASTYLILEPHRDWQGKVESISVENFTKRPPNLKSSQVALKIVIRVNSALFEQFIPEAVISIPDGSVLIVPEVEVVEPEDPAEIEGEALT